MEATLTTLDAVHHRSRLVELKPQLATAIASADDPAALQAIDDEINAIHASVKAALPAVDPAPAAPAAAPVMAAEADPAVVTQPSAPTS